jgi:hypothetical protein
MSLTVAHPTQHSGEFASITWVIAFFQQVGLSTAG